MSQDQSSNASEIQPTNTPISTNSSSESSKLNNNPFVEYESSGPSKKLSLPYKASAAVGAFIGIGSWLTYSFMFKVINKGRGKGVTLPYIPATTTQINNVISALKYQHNNLTPKYTNCLDIGSGNGEICIKVAKSLRYRE